MTIPDIDLRIEERLPPQNIDAEETILGGLMMDPEALSRVVEMLKPEAFYVDSHREIYRAALALNAQGKPSDIFILANYLEENKLLEKTGGITYLLRLKDAATNTINIDKYAQIVADKYARRQVIQAGQNISGLGYDTTIDVPKLLDTCEQTLFAVTQERVQRSLVPASEVLMNIFEQLESRYQQTSSIFGIPTHFYDLDNYTQGLQPSDLIIVAGRPGMGKCLGRGTPVLLHDGRVIPVEQVRTGDLLMGPDSQPRRVLSTNRGHGPLFRIHPNKGESWVCNDVHVLTLVHSTDDRIFDIPLDEYLSASAKLRHQSKLFRVGIEFPEQPTALDPYLFGLWLGDGTLSKPEITTTDQEIHDYVSAAAPVHGVRLNTRTDPRTGVRMLAMVAGSRGSGLVNPVLTALRESTVNGEKRIPQEYLCNSRARRLELLAGIVDTDGHLVSNCFEIVTRDMGLRDDILYLARSLGFAATVRPKFVALTSSERRCYWRIFLSGQLSEIPCRLPRKQALPRRQIKNVLRTGFRVEALGAGEYFGFTLDGDGRFLLGDFTVTHNTSFALALAQNVADKSGLPAVVFSLEMSKEQLVQRLLSSESEVESHRLRAGRVSENEWQRLGQAIGRLANIPLFIDDSPNSTVTEIRSKVRRLQAEQNGRLGLVMIDYLQLMEGSGSDNRVQELSKITRGLKGLARELNVPVMALSQLSRGVEARTNKRPMLSDLRESGSIEQDADIVIMLYRDDYYNPDSPERNIAEVIIVKHRNGPTGTVKLLFENQFTRFLNLSTGNH